MSRDLMLPISLNLASDRHILIQGSMRSVASIVGVRREDTIDPPSVLRSDRRHGFRETFRSRPLSTEQRPPDLVGRTREKYHFSEIVRPIRLIEPKLNTHECTSAGASAWGRRGRLVRTSFSGATLAASFANLSASLAHSCATGK
jgi:hypothetical protein